jgi:hypothetical protein
MDLEASVEVTVAVTANVLHSNVSRSTRSTEELCITPISTFTSRSRRFAPAGAL